MYEVKKILIPIDWTEHNHKLLPIAKSLAEKFQAQLLLINVVRRLDHFVNPYITSPDVDAIVEGRLKSSQEKLQNLLDSEFVDHGKVNAEVIIGDPAQEIVEYASKQGVDLIVMATHGRKGLEHAVFGSVAENVLRTSGVPVFIVNPYRASQDILS